MAERGHFYIACTLLQFEGLSDCYKFRDKVKIGYSNDEHFGYFGYVY
jgi:hypothetical protein